MASYVAACKILKVVGLLNDLLGVDPEEGVAGGDARSLHGLLLAIDVLVEGLGLAADALDDLNVERANAHIFELAHGDLIYLVLGKHISLLGSFVQLAKSLDSHVLLLTVIDLVVASGALKGSHSRRVRLGARFGGPVGDLKDQVLTRVGITVGLSVGAVPVSDRVRQTDVTVVRVSLLTELLEEGGGQGRLTWHGLVGWAPIVEDVLVGRLSVGAVALV